MKKILFFIFAIIGAILIFLLLSVYVLTDATTSLSETIYQGANESGNFHEYLQLSADYIKKVENDTIPDYLSFYQTVNYNYTDKTYYYRYFFFVVLPEDASIIDDPENVNKIPHLKVFLTGEGEDQLVYYSAEDEKVMGAADDDTTKMDFTKIKHFFFSFIINKNGSFRVELLTNSGAKFDEFSFIHQEEELTQTLTRDQYIEIFEEKDEYIKRLEAEVFNTLLDQYTKNHIVWLGMGGYSLLVIGLWFLFFGKVLFRFKKREENEEFE